MSSTKVQSTQNLQLRGCPALESWDANETNEKTGRRWEFELVYNLEQPYEVIQRCVGLKSPAKLDLVSQILPKCRKHDT